MDYASMADSVQDPLMRHMETQERRNRTLFCSDCDSHHLLSTSARKRAIVPREKNHRAAPLHYIWRNNPGDATDNLEAEQEGDTS
jgi:hypothetical protein